ncbi:MAG: AAA family ATPase [Planctomycetes bacterium]|nr:AAA family ATPase [Planctomycetota bacterium]
MLDRIHIARNATFGDTPEEMSGLSQFNYVYGANGTGKTTLSRVIAKCDEYPQCGLTWKNGTPLETVVYNRDFVSANFHDCDELPGIFTLGEKDAETIRKIAEAIDERDKLIVNQEAFTKTLQGEDGNGGKKAELAVLEDGFRDACWAQKQKHDSKLKGAFAGVRNSQDNFKAKVLQESESNDAALCDLADLESRAVTVFGNTPTLVTSIETIDSSALVECDKNSILAKRIVGKADIDIAALIIKLGNSDWVKAGRAFYQIEEGICPFCQQVTPDSLEKSLKEYFDEAFEKDTAAIIDLETKYRSEANRIQTRLNQLLSDEHAFLDKARIQAEKDLLDTQVRLDLEHIARKKKEPSLNVELEPLGSVLEAISGIIDDTNAKVTAHNTTVANLDSEKKKLTAQVWRYLLDVELKPALETFNTKKKNVSAAIDALHAKIEIQEALIAAKQAEIVELEKETTSIQPTINGINGLLMSFGFRGFQLTKADNQRCYKLIRPDGSDAKETLSEGERTFVTFLYFYHLLKGSTSESGTATNRVVVFDDPVSSLDSDILFIVGSLIKGLVDEVRAGTGQIKQIFVLTHNVYFHKEVTFNPKRKQEAMTEETFWTVRKTDLLSTLQNHSTNPIKTSYELLWAEVRSQNRTHLTIQNTLRRILENYFRILGGVDPDDICKKFEGKDRLMCKSLFSWVNDGSHSAHDDIYISIENSAVEGYLRVFREIFDKTGHLPHYMMMMGDAWVEVGDKPSNVADVGNNGSVTV